MLLAIGDVVRIRSDKTLGTVAGVAQHRGGNVIDVQLNGNTLRPVRPADVEVVARGFKTMTGARAVVTLLVFVLGFVAAYVNARYAAGLGANWSFLFFVAFVSFTSVSGGLASLVNRSRRIRV
ncbi:hypothetical protein ACX6XY_17825 [Streptomyces sp. O3]